MKKYLLASAATILIVTALLLNFNSKANGSDQNISTITVASYNPENLFDMVPNGSEYPEYIPNFKGWDELAHKTKLQNIAKVLSDINAEIVALQEIENENALKELLAELKNNKTEYPYYAITKNEKTAVQNALISKLKINSYKEISIKGQYRDRPILKAEIAVGENTLIVYANHWKAKTGAESKRIEYAETMANEIKSLDKKQDFIILGDLNSNYNEFETFVKNKKLNDTDGITGINHILKSVTITADGKTVPVTKAKLMADESGTLLYNLWLELPKGERASSWFAKEVNTPDNIMLPRSLFDKYGLSYEDESFTVFRPPYLFKNGRPFRWQMGGEGKRFSVPQGFSDHLPIVAKLRVGAFESKDKLTNTATKEPTQKKDKTDSQPIREATISELYNINGSCDLLLKKCVVIHKHFNNLILKQEGGRAIYAYNAPDDLELGGVYNIRVSKVEEYNGLKEIKSITDYKRVGAMDPQKLMLKEPKNLTDPSLQNEVLTGVSAIFSKGKLVFSPGNEIKVYFKDKTIKPKNLSKLKLKAAHIGSYNGVQIVIYGTDDFEIVE